MSLNPNFDSTVLTVHANIISRLKDRTDEPAMRAMGRALDCAKRICLTNQSPFDEFVETTGLSHDKARRYRDHFLHNPDIPNQPPQAAKLPADEVQEIQKVVQRSENPKAKRQSRHNVEKERLALALEFLTGRKVRPGESVKSLIDDALKHVRKPYQDLLSTPCRELMGFPTVYEYYRKRLTVE